MDRRKIYVIGVIMAAVCIISGIGGYFLASGHFGFEQNIAEENNNPYLNENGEPVISSPNKITPSTKIVYEYVYSEDGTVKTVEEEPPYFMLDLTFDDMLKYYPNWEIVSFSPQKVVMRKTIYGSDTQRYIVTDRDDPVLAGISIGADLRGLGRVEPVEVSMQLGIFSMAKELTPGRPLGNVSAGIVLNTQVASSIKTNMPIIDTGITVGADISTPLVVVASAAESGLALDIASRFSSKRKRRLDEIDLLGSLRNIDNMVLEALDYEVTE